MTGVTVRPARAEDAVRLSELFAQLGYPAPSEDLPARLALLADDDNAVLVAAEAWAHARGCRRMSVTSAEHRDDAHRFYETCGFPYTGRRFARALD